MDQVSCQLEIPEVKGLNPGEMSVGREARLICQGEWDKGFDFTKAKFLLSEDTKNDLKILKAEARDVKTFDVNMTLYIAGDWPSQQLVMTDGAKEINLGQQKFSVVSMIQKPAKEAAEPKPYGMILPAELSWPVLYFIFCVCILAIVVLSLVLQFRRIARFKEMMASLKQYESSLSPDLQFYKSIRQLEKQNFPMEEIEKSFRLYVLRVFQIPMFTLNIQQIDRFFKKRKSYFSQQRIEVRRLLEEFEEIKEKKIDLKSSDKEEILLRLYRFVDHNSEKGVVK